MAEPISGALLANAKIYREIAVEAAREAELVADEDTTVRDDGSKVLRHDPLRRSFKASLVAVAFAGMYIEALCWLVGCARIGIDEYRPIDRKPLERRLEALGVVDAYLLEDAKSFREARNGLVHENAVPTDVDRSPLRIAQLEAMFALKLITRIEGALYVYSPP